ncbi:ASCH domain-containing protein (plasmid) [Skermanella rosea]|uniref:ASCH domain-containing protein n=1 Tax=Skermanella rosea TaxID=1817965 RepID=UPI00193129E9|nr:ASCH domain-containing protein [Skermanella rosea]UEM07997.1 ASCH domain-containing protein [Skermanella rosea]
MKALSIQQPWAWLIVNGFKDIENRTWETRYRGPVLIHTGKRLDREAYEDLPLYFPDINLPPICELPLGGIVGQATITDCVPSHPSRWFSGPFGFVLTDAKTLPFLPCPGQLGFFVPEPSLTPQGTLL